MFICLRLTPHRLTILFEQEESWWLFYVLHFCGFNYDVKPLFVKYVTNFAIHCAITETKDMTNKPLICMKRMKPFRKLTSLWFVTKFRGLSLHYVKYCICYPLTFHVTVLFRLLVCNKLCIFQCVSVYIPPFIEVFRGEVKLLWENMIFWDILSFWFWFNLDL